MIAQCLHLGCHRQSLRRLMISKPHERLHVQHRTRSELRTVNEEHASPESKFQEARVQQSPPDGAQLRMGQLMLVVVALLWGTYSPAVRYNQMATLDPPYCCLHHTRLHHFCVSFRILFTQDGPPTPLALTAIRASLQSLVLIIPAALRLRQIADARQQQHNTVQQEPLAPSAQMGKLAGSSGIAGVLKADGGPLRALLNKKSSNLWVAGVRQLLIR